MSPTPAWVKQLKPSGPQGHELLAAERANSNIPVEKVSELLFTKEVLEKNQRILDIIKSEKVFDKSQKNVVSRTELFRDALAKAKRLRMLQVEKGWSQDEYRTAMGFISEPLPYGLHDGMFVVSTYYNLLALFLSVGQSGNLEDIWIVGPPMDPDCYVTTS